MRTISRCQFFKRDFKRKIKSPHSQKLDTELQKTVELLVADKSLPKSYRDHSLAGEWKDHRECHIKHDLLLIYRKKDASTLDLVRLGSHSDLFD